MKKKIIILIAVVSAIVILAGAFAVFACNPRFSFIISESVKSRRRSVAVEEIECDTHAYTLEELAAMDHVTVNTTLYLINSEYMLSESFDPAIVAYNGAEMSPDILSSYKALSADIKEHFDTPLYVISSYRTKEEQEEIVADHDSDVAASVGASEHQSGLALDVYVTGYSGASIISCEAGQYLNTECWRHGFIIRYPYGKKDITGITYEPWHIRYVGAPHAEIIYMNSLTYEEYVEALVPNLFFSYNGYIISRQNMIGETLQIPDNAESIVISEDNTGFYIITAKVS